MAVNQALIQASRGTGEQFIDYGAVIQPAVKGMMRKLEIADNKMASFVNSLPPDANIEKLPEGMRPEVERYLRDSKNEYAEAAKVASKLSPSDAGYREAVDKMNSIKTGFVNLNKNLEAHLANRVEFIQDKDDLSGSLLDNDNIFLTSVYAGDYEGFKVTGGELEFLDKSTNKYKRNSEFPQYSLTDAVGANKITDLRFSARKNGLQGIIDTEGYQMGVSNLFKGLGAQGVIDMAFDGLDNAAGNFVDTEIRNFKEFKNLSDEQWAVEREKLKTKEGFSNYFIPFQQHVSRLVNAGAIEGKAAYDKTINLDGGGDDGVPVFDKSIKVKKGGNNNYEKPEVAKYLYLGLSDGVVNDPITSQEYRYLEGKDGLGWYVGDNLFVDDGGKEIRTTNDLVKNFGIQDNRFQNLETKIVKADNRNEGTYDSKYKTGADTTILDGGDKKVATNLNNLIFPQTDTRNPNGLYFARVNLISNEVELYNKENKPFLINNQRVKYRVRKNASLDEKSSTLKKILDMLNDQKLLKSVGYDNKANSNPNVKYTYRDGSEVSDEIINKIENQNK